MVQISDMSRYWIFQVFQYARVVNIQGHTEFTHVLKYTRFLNMRQDSIMDGLWIFQVLTYAGITQVSEYAWV